MIVKSFLHRPKIVDGVITAVFLKCQRRSRHGVICLIVKIIRLCNVKKMEFVNLRWLKMSRVSGTRDHIEKHPLNIDSCR